MPRLPAEADTEKVIRVFERVGFKRDRRSGSHEILKRPGPLGTVSVKHPIMHVGLLKSCLRDAGMSTKEFLELYHK